MDTNWPGADIPSDPEISSARTLWLPDPSKLDPHIGERPNHAEDDPHLSRQKTLIFDIEEARIRRFVAVTIGQSTGIDKNYGNGSDGPLLPPLYSVWVRITTDFKRSHTQTPLYLHWGICLPNGDWQLPRSELPKKSTVWNNAAVRTLMTAPAAGATTRSAWINLGQPQQCPGVINFVLYSPHDNLWIRSASGQNFCAPVQPIIAEVHLQSVRDTLVSGISRAGASLYPSDTDVALYCPANPDVHHIFELPGKRAELDVAIWTTDEAVIIEIMTNLRVDVVLHWGLVTAKPIRTPNGVFDTQCLMDTWEEVWEPPDPRLR